MYQRQSPLFTGAAGSAAFALSPSVTAPAAQGGEATPSVPPLPHTGKRRRIRSRQEPRSLEAAASFTPFLTVLAGAMQWVYYPASRPDF
jgi:hypothetical protein